MAVSSTAMYHLQQNLLNIGHLNPTQITVTVGMLHLFNFQSLSDIIKMRLYRNSKENELNLWSEILAWGDENLPDIVLDSVKQGKEMAFHWCSICLHQTLWMRL